MARLASRVQCFKPHMRASASSKLYFAFRVFPSARHVSRAATSAVLFSNAYCMHIIYRESHPYTVYSRLFRLSKTVDTGDMRDTAGGGYFENRNHSDGSLVSYSLARFKLQVVHRTLGDLRALFAPGPLYVQTQQSQTPRLGLFGSAYSR